jgi:hypothetical protein
VISPRRGIKFVCAVRFNEGDGIVGMGSEAVFLILINQSSMYEGISHLVKSVRVTDHYSPASATFETHERSYSNSMASFGCDMFFTLTIPSKRLSAS